MKFKIKARLIEVQALFDILPVNKLLTCNLPPNAEGLVEATFTSTIGLKELKKIMHRVANGFALMESFKVNYD